MQVTAGVYDNSIKVLDDVLECQGDIVVFTTGVPLLVESSEILTISGNGILTLECAEGKQPCIGVHTYTGMSYGRWSPADRECQCKKLIIDGVKVICKSKTPNFSLGAYNYETYPEIECINGGTIECPEIHGKRYLKTEAFPPSGSTKISMDAEYVIGTENLYSEEQRSLIARLGEKWVDKVSYKIPVKFLEEAIKLLELNPECNITPLISEQCLTSKMIARTMSILDMPLELYSKVEFQFESKKLEFIVDKYSSKGIDGESAESIVRRIVKDNFKDVEKLSDWNIEVLYEMIPSYSFMFSGASHKESVIAFYSGYDSVAEYNQNDIAKYAESVGKSVDTMLTSLDGGRKEMKFFAELIGVTYEELCEMIVGVMPTLLSSKYKTTEEAARSYWEKYKELNNIK